MPKKKLVILSLTLLSGLSLLSYLGIQGKASLDFTKLRENQLQTTESSIEAFQSSLVGITNKLNQNTTAFNGKYSELQNAFSALNNRTELREEEMLDFQEYLSQLKSYKSIHANFASTIASKTAEARQTKIEKLELALAYNEDLANKAEHLVTLREIIDRLKERLEQLDEAWQLSKARYSSMIQIHFQACALPCLEQDLNEFVVQEHQRIDDRIRRLSSPTYQRDTCLDSGDWGTGCVNSDQAIEEQITRLRALDENLSNAKAAMDNNFIPDLKESTEAYNATKNSITTLEEHYATLEENTTPLSPEAEAILTRIEAKEATLQTKETTLAEKENLKNTLENRIDSYHRSIESFEESIASTQLTLLALRNQKALLEVARTETRDPRDLKEIREEIELIDAQITAREASLLELREGLSTYQVALSSAETDLATINSELAPLKKEVKELTKDIEELEEAYQAEQDESHPVTIALERAKAQLESWRAQKTRLQTDLEAMTASIQSSRRQIASFTVTAPSAEAPIEAAIEADAEAPIEADETIEISLDTESSTDTAIPINIKSNTTTSIKQDTPDAKPKLKLLDTRKPNPAPNTDSKESTSLEENAFTDIQNHWGKEMILTAYEKQWIQGYKDKKFQPDQSINLAEFFKILSKSLELEEGATSATFSQAPQWAQTYIAALEELDIVRKRDGLIQRFDTGLSRCDAALYIARGYQLRHTTESEPSFSDVKKTDYCAYAIEALAQNGILSGYEGGLFKPNQKLSRAEALKIIVKAKETLAK